MSALARWFRSSGYNVGGYDKTSSALIKELQSEGIDIHFKDDVEMIPESFKKDGVLVVYTPAIPANHSELLYFIKHSFPVKKRSEVLGLLTKSFFTIGIAGTHGKTTTSSMVAHILKHAGKNVFAFIGGIARNYQTNLLLGDKNSGDAVMVVEADEYDRSFLTLDPDIAVITSMDADHLDIYGDEASVHESFNAYIEKIKTGGVLVYKADLPVIDRKDIPSISFGEKAGNHRIENLKVAEGVFVFDIAGEFGIKGIRLSVPGLHNAMNAMAAFIAAVKAGVTPEKAKEALASFMGVKRRFELIVNNQDIKYIDDYAHHPTEIEACLNAARSVYPDKNLTVVFQPHLFSRTRDFMNEFANALSKADNVILLPVYPARELPIPGIDSEAVIEKISLTEKRVCSKEELINVLKTIKTDVLITMGAGDIDTLIEPIKMLYTNEKIVK